MTSNTKELGLEALIVAHLRDVNGYVEGKSDLYSKEEALVKSWRRRRSHLGPLRRGENDGRRTRRSHHHHGKFALQFRRQRAAL